MKRLTHYVQSGQIHPKEIVNWHENHISDSLLYSYRNTFYDRSSFPSSLHYHDYYELVIFEEGDIHYVCESEIYAPKQGDVIVIPPKKLHMSKIVHNSTQYKRHVFYLNADAFDSFGHPALCRLLHQSDEGRLFTLSSPTKKEELMSLLSRLSATLRYDSDDLERALGLGYVIQIFYLLNQKQVERAEKNHQLPENVLALQRYLDENYAELTSVSQVAEQFFYSREYVSRLFKRHFDTTILDYVKKRRISLAQTLIEQGYSITDVCYQAGFGSFSTFIRSFRQVTGMSPSEYRSIIFDGTSSEPTHFDPAEIQ